MKPRRNLFLGSFLVAFSMVQAHAGVKYWDADGDTSTATGGTGTWTTVNTWRALTSTGTLGSWVGYDDAVFGGTAGTVTASGTVQANSLQFDTTGYSITGGTIQLGNPAAPGLYVVTGGSASISSAFTNSGAGNAIHIGKAGYAGTLTLTNFSGLTANNRALAIDYGNLYLSTATTALTGTTGGVSIASGASLTYDNSGTVTWGSTSSTNLTGTGTFIKKGAGNLIFGGSSFKLNVNLSTGAVIDLQAGSIESSSNNNGIWTSNYADLNVASGATFNLKENKVYIGALTGAGTVQQSYTCTGPSLTIGRGDRSGAFSGIIKDNGYVASVEKVGTGTQTLSGANTFTGKTLISGGKIALGNALALQNSAYDTTGSTGAIGLDVTGYATPTLGGLMGSVNLATAITGYGSVTNLTLNPQSGVSNAYSGIIANGASSGMTLTKTGAGTQALSGPNTYSGGTTLTTGALQIGVASVGSVGSITSSAIGKGTLTFNGGTLSSDSTTARTILNAVTFTGNAVLGDATKNGKLTFAAGLNLGAVARTMTLNSDVQLDGAFSNPGTGAAVTKAGNGTLTINVSNAGVNFGTGNPSGFQITAGKVVATNTAAFGSAGQIVTLNGGTGTTAGSTVEFATDSSPNAYVLNQNSINNGTVILNRATSGTAIAYSMGTATLGQNSIFNVQKGANVTDTPTLTLAGLTMTAGSAGTTTLSPTTANISITGGVNSNSNYAKTLQLDGTSTGNIISGTITNGTNVVTLTKANSGTWTLSGVNNAYTGPTNISGGTLKAGSSTAFNNTSGLAMTGTSIFDLNGFNAAFTTFSGVAGNTITNSSTSTGASNATTAGTPTGTGIYVDALRLSTAGQTIASQITDGATRDTQLIINNANSSSSLAGITNTSNSFSGGLVLANNASGTRLRISSAITGTPLGSGPIIIGQAATDKAGILLDTVDSITLANNIVFNTALGTDFPGIRLDTANHVFSGKITANLANAKFSNGGSASLTGQVTGASGLEIDGPTITLNNVGTANDYLGATTIATGTLKLGAANQIPNGSGKGNVAVAGTLDLNGYSDTINGLSGAGIVDNLVASGGATNTLVLGDNNATGSTFTGTIKNTAGSLEVVKIGSGTQSLQTGVSTFSGGLTIKNGTIIALNSTVLGGAGGNSGTINLGDTTGSNSASLLTGVNNATISNPVVLATNASVGTLKVGSSGNNIVTYTGGVTGTNRFTIANGGTQTLAFSTVAINNVGTVTNAGAGSGSTSIAIGFGSNVTDVIQNSTTSTLSIANGVASTNTGSTYIKAGTLQLNGPGGGTAITPLSSGTIYLGDTAGSIVATLALGNTNVLANPIVVQSNSNASTKAIHVNTSGVPVYSGGITLNDNLDITTSSSSGLTIQTEDVTINNSSTLSFKPSGTNAGTFTVSSNVTGTGGSVVFGGTTSGSPTYMLSGANTYTGTTSIIKGKVNAGIADGVGTGAFGNGGNITFGGGTLQYSAASAGTDYAARIKNSASEIKLDMNAQTVNLAGVIDSSNTQGLSITGGGLLTLSGSSANTYTGTTTLNNASAVTLSKTPGQNAVGGDVSIALGGTLQLGASDQIPDAAVVTLAAIGGGTWAYWNLMGYNETITGLSANNSSNAIIQNNSGSAGTSILTIKNSVDYGYTGRMRNGSTGVLALVKDGSGKQTLAGQYVDYTGATTIKAGTLELLSSATAFASAVGFDTGSTGTLQINGASGKIGGLSSVDSTTNTAFVQNEVGTDAVLTINQAGNSSFGGIIRDNTGGNKIGITKTGAGVLTLSGANTFTGGVTLNGTTNGGFRITNSSSLGGDGVATKTVNFYQGTNGVAELDMDPGVAGSITLSDKINFLLSSNSTTGSGIVSRTGTNEIKGTITMQGGLASSAISSSAGATLTLSGVISANASGRTLHLGGDSTNANTISGNMNNSANYGDFNVSKNNSGTWILTGTNSYTGTTTINAGLLKASGGSAIPDAGLVSLADVAGATFQVVGSEAIGALSGGGTTGGTVSIDASQTLTLASGTQTFGGIITGSGALRLNASAVIQTLTGDNDYAGSTSINYGILNIQHANALGGTASGTTVASGATLQLQGGKNFATETLTIAGQGVSNSGVLRSISGNNTWNGDITVGSGALTRVAADADTLTLAGNVTLSTTAGDQLVLQGAGNIDVTGQITGVSRVTSSSTGAGIRTLSNASNDYAGDTGVNGGVLQAGVTNALPYGTGKGNLVLNGGSSAVGVFNLNGYDVATNGLAGTSGTFVGEVVNNADGTTKTLTIGYNDATASFAGILADNNNSGTGVLAINKTGTGVQTLTGTNTYTGATTVTAGTLVINGNISTSTTTVQSGGTLGGNGTSGSVIVENGGTLAPGTSPGTLTVSGNLGLNDSSILAFEFDPFDTTVGSNINDLVTGISNFTLDGLLNVTATSGSFGGVTSGSWRLFNYSGTLTNNILTLNSMPTLASGYSWTLDTATTGQVNLTVVPEPRAALLGGLGMLALLRRRRK